MATQPAGDRYYEVIEWDFDAAPDAVEYFSDDYSESELSESILPYYCARRQKVASLRDAIDIAHDAFECKTRVGVAVFEGAKMVEGFGVTFSYREKYL